MNRNQKIALGCGGAGCLGILLVAVVGAVAYMVYQSKPAPYSSTETNRSSNTNVRRSEEGETPATNESTESSSSFSNDEKHKLFQAASMSGDPELIQRVLKKIGFNPASADYQQFTQEHFAWAMKNVSFIQSLSTPEKAKAYVEEHLGE